MPNSLSLLSSANAPLDSCSNMVPVSVGVVPLAGSARRSRLDDDECSRGNTICPTNSFCRNTPGSYAVCSSGVDRLSEKKQSIDSPPLLVRLRRWLQDVGRTSVLRR